MRAPGKRRGLLVTHLSRFFDGRPPARITRDGVERCQAPSAKKGPSSSTVNNGNVFFSRGEARDIAWYVGRRRSPLRQKAPFKQFFADSCDKILASLLLCAWSPPVPPPFRGRFFWFHGGTEPWRLCRQRFFCSMLTISRGSKCVEDLPD